MPSSARASGSRSIVVGVGVLLSVLTRIDGMVSAASLSSSDARQDRMMLGKETERNGTERNGTRGRQADQGRGAERARTTGPVVSPACNALHIARRQLGSLLPTRTTYNRPTDHIHRQTGRPADSTRARAREASA